MRSTRGSDEPHMAGGGRIPHRELGGHPVNTQGLKCSSFWVLAYFLLRLGIIKNTALWGRREGGGRGGGRGGSVLIRGYLWNY